MEVNNHTRLSVESRDSSHQLAALDGIGHNDPTLRLITYFRQESALDQAAYGDVRAKSVQKSLFLGLKCAHLKCTDDIELV